MACQTRIISAEILASQSCPIAHQLTLLAQHVRGYTARAGIRGQHDLLASVAADLMRGLEPKVLDLAISFFRAFVIPWAERIKHEMTKARKHEAAQSPWEADHRFVNRTPVTR